MLNKVKLSAKNLALVEELVAANGGSPYFTRKRLLELHQKLRGRKCNPYFITKNIQAKLSSKEKEKFPRGTLTVLRFLKFAQKHPPAPMPSKEYGRKENIQKKETKGRKEVKKEVHMKIETRNKTAA